MCTHVQSTYWENPLLYFYLIYKNRTAKQLMSLVLYKNKTYQMIVKTGILSVLQNHSTTVKELLHHPELWGLG
jgi:hypothetical protein